ncbi:MAG: multiprotein bridging factor aMBF1 [Methanomassiliicoccaceae archaeon]|nr:multiprotein bridging factor aMBF1 [Methanomassiliicoccaceae archaeon]
MICEMCGKEVPITKPMLVEGSKLNLCPNCARFGDEYKAANATSSTPGAAPVPKTVIEDRLQRRERRMQTRDIYSASSRELIDNYGEAIRSAREAKGLDLEEFAKSIFERKGTVARIEANDLVPDDKLIAKFEKALDIRLKEEVMTGGQGGSGSSKSESMTLSNFIKKK